MSTSIRCGTCKSVYSEDRGTDGLEKTGEIVNINQGPSKGLGKGPIFVGVCPYCRKGPPTSTNIGLEMSDLSRSISKIRGEHPELSLEQACRLGVKLISSPYREKDEGFRAYLLECGTGELSGD